MKKEQVMKMIKSGEKVEIVCLHPPLQNRIYKVNGQIIRSNVGDDLMNNCPSGVFDKPNINMYVQVTACIYN